MKIEKGIYPWRNFFNSARGWGIMHSYPSRETHI